MYSSSAIDACMPPLARRAKYVYVMSCDVGYTHSFTSSLRHLNACAAISDMKL